MSSERIAAMSHFPVECLGLTHTYAVANIVVLRKDKVCVASYLEIIQPTLALINFLTENSFIQIITSTTA